jgi:hypothetical protein
MATDKITLGTLELPPDLFWSDEHKWLPVGASAKRSLTGASIVQVGQFQAGRPITLEGAVDFAWVTYATVEALRSMAGEAETYRSLVLPDGRQFTVRFRLEDTAVEAEPVSHRVTPDTAVRDQLQYVPIIRLATVN